MQKKQQKILFIGNDEGPKALFEQRLFNLVPRAPRSGISLEIRPIFTPTVHYAFWCVDSHELINVREPVHYYQHCDYVFIIPKDDADLKLIFDNIKDHIDLTFIVLVPADDFIKHLPENQNHRLKLITSTDLLNSSQVRSSQCLANLFEHIKTAEHPVMDATLAL